jgi:hypothetical protein
MEPDEQAEVSERKRQINNFIWENAPGCMSLADAEVASVRMLDAFERAEMSMSPRTDSQMAKAMEAAG